MATKLGMNGSDGIVSGRLSDADYSKRIKRAKLRQELQARANQMVELAMAAYDRANADESEEFDFTQFIG